MKIKNLFAGAAACALAVSGMSLSASALIKDDDATMLSGYALEDEWGAYMDMKAMYDKVEEVKTCEITVSDAVFNGTVVIAAESNSWGWNENNSATDNGNGTFTVAAPCDLKDTDSLVKISVKDWDTSDQHSTVVKIVLKNANGDEVFSAGDGNAVTTEKATTTTTTTTTTKAGGTTTTSSTQKGSNTGDAGVGMAVAGLSLAGAVAFIARKKN